VIAAGEAATEAGRTQNVLRSVAITELQANQLLAYQATLVTRAEERNVLLERILGTLTGEGVVPVLPPPVGITTTPSHGGGVHVSIGPVELTVGRGTSTEQAEVIGQAFVDEVSRLLGERLASRQLLYGYVS
jgi:hypothetical protein